MKQFRFLLIGLMAVLALTLTACGGGGGGGGGGSAAVVTDNDGDGIPNIDDGAPGDASTFIEFLVTQLERFTGGTFSAGVDVNNAVTSQVVGYSEDAAATLKGALWTVNADGTASVPTELSPIDGNDYSAAYGINDDGVAVGESEEGASTVAVVWDAAGAVSQLSALAASQGINAAYAINGAGQIVGEDVIDAAGNTTAVLWDSSADTEPTDLGTLGGAFSAAYHISEGGLVVGESGVSAGGEVHGVLWEESATTPATYELLALPPLTDHVASVAFGMDAGGRIVGESEAADGTLHGVIWTLDRTTTPATVTATDLGASTTASAVNGFNRVAGATAAGSGSDQAAVWDTRNTELPNAVTATATFSQAYDINDSDEVVGVSDGQAYVALPQ